MFTVTFVRHGETKTNAAGITQGHGPGELTTEGIEMTMKVGKRLKTAKFTRIYSSDLKRCKDTTQNILKCSEVEQPDVIYREDLRERNMGDMEMQPWQLVLDIAAKQECGTHCVVLPGAESYENVTKRAVEFFEMMCSFAKDSKDTENILVVCHGCWLKSLFFGHITKSDMYQVENFEELHTLHKKARPSITNTAVTKIAIADKCEPKRTITVLNLLDVSHLNED